MTTRQKPYSRRPTANNRAAQRASAERRRCPKCRRKAALVTVRDFSIGIRITSCRWSDCDYEASRALPVIDAGSGGEG